MNYILICILISALVNYLIRVIPYIADFTGKMPSFLKKCVSSMPMAALGALVFPAVIIDFESYWYAGILGLLGVIISSIKIKTMIIPIILSVIIAYFVITFI